MQDLPVHAVGFDIMKSILIKSPAAIIAKLNRPADQNELHRGHIRWWTKYQQIIHLCLLAYDQFARMTMELKGHHAVGFDIMKSILIKSPAAIIAKLNRPADQNELHRGHIRWWTKYQQIIHLCLLAYDQFARMKMELKVHHSVWQV